MSFQNSYRQERPVKICVVVLNWNNADATIKCIESLVRSELDGINLTVVVCDNGSTDDSVERIETCMKGLSEYYLLIKNTCTTTNNLHQYPLVLIENGENIGYARGNNRGIEFGLLRDDDYVLVLNNDIVVEPAAIKNLVIFGESNQEAALMTPRIHQEINGAHLIENADDLVQPSIWSFIIPSFLLPKFKLKKYKQKEIIDSPKKIYYAPGCAMMFRTEVIKRVGMFDENTFLYYEELIMAEKLKKKGLTTYYVTTSDIWHYQGNTTKKLSPAKKYIYSVVSQKLYFSKYRQENFYLVFLLILKITISYLFKSIQNKEFRKNIPIFFADYYK